MVPLGISIHLWLCFPLCWFPCLADFLSVVARWPPAALGIYSVSLAIQQKEIISLLRIWARGSGFNLVCLIQCWSRTHPRTSYCVQKDVVFSLVQAESLLARGSATSIHTMRWVSERCDSPRKRWTVRVDEGLGRPTTGGYYRVLHSEVWGGLIDSFSSSAIFSIECPSFWVQPTNKPEK